ncbi:MAG: di-heme oxidoredictase family protein [Myxococcota bacterium]|nr:di-heme oxidoredictase family protein [Myxococcota bacterium]
MPARLVLVSCGEAPTVPDLTGVTADGVAAGIFAPMGQPMPRATEEQRMWFERGKAVAQRTMGPSDGLGPSFNAVSCMACHEKPAVGGSSGRYRDFLMLEIDIDEVEEFGVQVLPHYDLNDVRTPTDSAMTKISKRNAPAIFGTGLLQAVPGEELIRLSDPDDLDGDGISGRVNYERGELARFGSKAHSLTVEEFTRAVLSRHQGISSDILPLERKAQLPIPLGKHVQASESDFDDIPDPELSEDDLFALISFVMLLAPPTPDAPTPTTVAGRETFLDIGCGKCHAPLLNSPLGGIPAYTDLLIHDMGPELADGLPLALASGSEFRTTPLWGVVASGPWLHDGRAETIDEAIRLHGGEATGVRDSYVSLPPQDRQNLIAFLESLGGRELANEGMLPPDAAAPAVGELGGPGQSLSNAEQEQFTTGLHLFDRDAPIGEGLGPYFNGDSCRACHFQGAVGGAGPPGVDVIRHGVVNSDGQFVAPALGTMAYHYTTDRTSRPPVGDGVNFYEARQAPPLFGLGMLERVEADAILDLADPDDADGDGVSGRAVFTPDGRLARFGWKLSFPDLREAMRDAMSTELGLSVPTSPGSTFGVTKDSDDIPDPELGSYELDAILHYMANLGPPLRHHDDPATEALGEHVFNTIGCGSCHVPSLPTPDGPVAAYTDLLLHEVMPLDAMGIAEGPAGMREFRTAPLWGARHSAPYMHDGRAWTIDEAIRAHAGEAAAPTQWYQALAQKDQDALVAFVLSL